MAWVEQKVDRLPTAKSVPPAGSASLRDVNLPDASKVAEKPLSYQEEILKGSGPINDGSGKLAREMASWASIGGFFYGLSPYAADVQAQRSAWTTRLMTIYQYGYTGIERAIGAMVNQFNREHNWGNAKYGRVNSQLFLWRSSDKPYSDATDFGKGDGAKSYADFGEGGGEGDE